MDVNPLPPSKNSSKQICFLSCHLSENLALCCRMMHSASMKKRNPVRAMSDLSKYFREVQVKYKAAAASQVSFFKPACAKKSC